MAALGVFDDEYYATLAVLGDEILGGDPALDAAAILAAGRCLLLAEMLEDTEQRQRQPTRVADMEEHQRQPTRVADMEEHQRQPTQVADMQQCERQPTRVEGYVEHVLHIYNNHEFKDHFRMERQTFERLEQLLVPHLPSRQVTPEKKLLASLWLLGTKESFRGVADRFDLNKGFLHGILLEVCRALEAVQAQVLSWPAKHEQSDIAERFLQKTGFPGIVGCIDGTHIPIPGPALHTDSYINSKGFPSIQVQAVCDDNLRFLDVVTGWPGSVNDARVFRNSPLYGILEGGNVGEDHHLLGDSAYDLAMYMMVPFRDNGHLSDEERNYNGRHTSARVAIEKAFGLLKSKFRRLQYLEMRVVEKIPTVIFSACVLHNFILMTESLDMDDILEDVANLHDGNVHQHGDDPHPGNSLAINKRNKLANLFA